MDPFSNDPVFGEPLKPAVAETPAVATPSDPVTRLQAEQELRDTFTNDGQEFTVITELDKNYRGWLFRTYVTVNNRKIDEMDYPALALEEKGGGGTEDQPLPKFLERAVKRHQERCAEVQQLIADKRAQKTRATRTRLILAVLTVLTIGLIAGGGYYFRFLHPVKEERQVAAITGESFEYVLPVSRAILTSDMPNWLRFDDAALRLHGVPPDSAKGTLYPITFETQTPKGHRTILTVQIAVKGKFDTPQLILEYSTIRGKVEPDQYGVATITLKKTDVITVKVIDKITKEPLAEGIINVKLAE